jgi:hypothetical protein
MDAINARWDEFEELDAAGQSDLFVKTLDEPELMDDEMAFEMLSAINKWVIQSGRHDLNVRPPARKRCVSLPINSRKHG